MKLGPADIVVDRRPDGTLLVRSPHPLGTYPERVTDSLDHWARHASYRTFLAQRDARGHWRNVTYAEAQYFARRIGQALVNRQLSVEHPILIISGNDIENALLTLGAAYTGIPCAIGMFETCLVTKDFTPIRRVVDLIKPGLIFAADGRKYSEALSGVADGAEVVVTENPVRGATLFADLVNTEPAAGVEHAHSGVGGETVLKIVYGAGRNGSIQTHRMWCSNQEMARSYLRFLADEPPVFVDWLPWGLIGSSLELTLYNGGSYYLDTTLEALTFRNLRVIAPTICACFPDSLERLVAALRADAGFSKHFFSRLTLLYCLAPWAPQDVIDDFIALSIKERGECIPCVTSIEIGSHAMFGDAASNQPNALRVPAPGVELKLVPTGGETFDLRTKGPNVTWGYWRKLAETQAAFDEERFFKTGEMLKLIDSNDPTKGFLYHLPPEDLEHSQEAAEQTPQNDSL